MRIPTVFPRVTPSIMPSRRRFLAALAVGAGSHQFGDFAKGPWLGGRVARAAGEGPPRRVVFITHPNGLHEDKKWSSWAQGGASETEFSFAGMTTPLEKHKSEVVIFDSLQLFPTIDGCQHGQGYTALWTANFWKLERDYRPKGAWGSIDQYLGAKLGKMLTPKMPSIFLGAHSHSGSGGATFGMDGGYLKPVNSPYDGYASLFSDFMPSSSSGTAATIDPAVKLRLALRKSVLDGVAKDVTAFAKRLGAEDRARADAQLSSLRTLEDRLSTNVGVRGATCGKPAQTEGLNLADGKSHPEICKMHFDLITSAFACDMTRIVHFNMGGQTKPQTYVSGGTDCHDMSHNKRDLFVEMKKLWFGHVAAFVDKLKAIPEPGPGGAPGTMLDNTLIVIGSEIGAGHTHKAVPFMTIGGKNMGVRVGRYLRFGRPPIVRYPKYIPSGVIDDGGEPHNRLLVAVLNAMGLPDKTFGATVPEFDSGPLPGFLAG